MRMSTALQLGSISISESEFFAQDTLVVISPTFRHPAIRFISVRISYKYISFTLNKSNYVKGTFGPFEPYIPVPVPLWLAVDLKKKEKCSIDIPEWLSVGTIIK